MNNIFKIIIFIFFFLASALHGQYLQKNQIQTLQLVKKIALQYPNKKNETFEHTAMSICLTETSAGLLKLGDVKRKNPNIFRSSLGLMQVRLQTARFIAKKLSLHEINKLDDAQLASKLINDDAFNISIAVRYLVWLSEHTQSYFQMVSRYNGGNINHPYYNRVLANLKVARKILDIQE